MVVDLIVPPLAVVSKTTLVGLVQALAAGGADGLAPALVFIVGGHVADAGVQADGVVLDLDPVELDAEHGRVCDRQQVGPLGLQGAVQCLASGIVSHFGV